VDNYVDVLIEKGGFPEAIKGTIVMPKYTKASIPKLEEVLSVVMWLHDRQLIKKTYKYGELVQVGFTR
jgi:NitT/TauT family transport system substrate-binding protein